MQGMTVGICNEMQFLNKSTMNFIAENLQRLISNGENIFISCDNQAEFCSNVTNFGTSKEQRAYYCGVNG